MSLGAFQNPQRPKIPRPLFPQVWKIPPFWEIGILCWWEFGPRILGQWESRHLGLDHAYRFFLDSDSHLFILNSYIVVATTLLVHTLPR